MGYVGRAMARCGCTLVVFVAGVAMIGAGSGAAMTSVGITTRSASRYLHHDVFAAVAQPSVGGNALTNLLSGLSGVSGGVYLMDDAGANVGSGRNSGDHSGANVTRSDAAAEALPWTVRVTYSLDGPQKTAAEVSGASGLVGVRVVVERNPIASRDIAAQAEQLVPMIAFTVPSDIADDISVNDGTIVAQHGSDTLITAVGKAGGHIADDGGIVEDLVEGNLDAATNQAVLDVSIHLTATRFSMSAVTLAAVPANDATTFAAQINALATQASTLTDTATGAGSQGNEALITELTALRDHERELAKTTIAARTAAHQQAFDAYMAAYVGSYTTHLSGSIGTSTQLPALIGTAKELSGDTPLATAVVDLANAVNAVSAAHRHTGAADEVDAIIRRIRQQGTSGLVRELKQQAGTESSQGSKGYSDGQSQLSQAMIPYSMAYTDTYTKHLSELTGGTSAGASAYRQQAIVATNADFTSVADLKDDQAKVDAAMSALATASEHTGAAQAIQQLLLRYEDEFENGDDSGDTAIDGVNDHARDADDSTSDDAAGNADDSGKRNAGASASAGSGMAALRSAASRNSIAATVETKRQQALAKARHKAAVEQRKAQDAGQITSLVDDNVAMSKDDVMNFAGGVASIGGGAGTDKGSGSPGSSGGSSANAASNGDGSAEATGGTSAGTSDKSGATGSSGGTAGASGSSSNTSDATGTSDAASSASTTATALDETPSVAYGMRGMGSATLLIPGGDGHIGETLAIGDSADVLAAAVKALQDNGKLADLGGTSHDNASARFVMVIEAPSA
ncbi:hypothetical protein [Bifidobacterium biavatii]|uniref:Tubuliform spidroin n=1 Tax=Bifidobacterium biavatii DSM 23969 TaxID=1437608 RepID=A0A086ZMY3_9BIFI|nr:hypothetical protein [Bifidobacterium biavatii]KFI47883.1 hypothetical protein BBIA_0012 [Bifidobacterium biavatii DSM 23969]